MSEPRTMPQNIEAEQSVIGGVLLGAKLPALSHKDFYRAGQALIFRTMLSLDVKQEPIDFVTATEELRRMGKLEEAGGASYLASLTERTPSIANVDLYANIVRDKAVLRRIIDECRCVAEMAFERGAKGQEIVDHFQATAMEMTEGVSTDTSLMELAKKQLRQIESAYKEQEPLLGIPSGFKELDGLTLGWQATDLTVIAARPSMGKTALALDVAKAAAREGNRVFFASLEMSAEQITMRLFSSECGISGRALRLGRFPEGDWNHIVAACGRVADLEIIIDDTGAISELELVRRVRRIKPDLLVVDYLQLMRGAQKAERKDLEIASITATLKVLAKELNIPVILLSQLNRLAEKRQNPRPRLSDLRDSGAIEQDADLVLGIYRDLDKAPGVAELICLKHRNGPLGTIELAFRENLASFGGLARD